MPVISQSLARLSAKFTCPVALLGSVPALHAVFNVPPCTAEPATNQNENSKELLTSLSNLPDASAGKVIVYLFQFAFATV